MTATMFDSLPAALLALFLAACVLWLIWRALRRLVSPRRRRLEPSLGDEPDRGRIEQASPQTPVVSTIPDAADVLALKAAIDNLARQVAALEKRLAPGPASPPPQPVPVDRTAEQSPVIPSVSPDHRI
jgi:flagellar biosynthesis/type III secretory pathway M-ring protein FliF/YscJ